MAEKRMTKRELFASVLTYLPAGAVAERELIEKAIARLETKRAGSGKPTAKQMANESMKAAIVEFMLPEEKYTIAQLMDVVGESNQKVSALMAQLVKAGVVIRGEEKRKAFFVLAE